ncbi:MAG: zinc-dependent metalloprotease [Bacteroidia bacterium]|nr:zinc-dependent metalloprotease [Bacteroidia bacterium]
MNKHILITIISLLLVLKVIGQKVCTTDERNKGLLRSSRELTIGYYKEQLKIDSIINTFQKSLTSNSVVTIPTVIHIMHLGEPIGVGSNAISDAAIISEVNLTNQHFRGQVGDGIDTQIEFCLAKTDPSGCTTNGIDRVDCSSVPGYSSNTASFDSTQCGGYVSETVLLSQAYWPNYYNIWIVKSCVAEAYSSGFYQYLSGAVMTPVVFLNGNSLTHENGHSLSLLHTFNGDWAGCPTNTNCATDGDKCCDTPPHQVGDCGAINPCTPTGVWDNSKKNYMSYCGTTRTRFTADQKNRMQAYLLLNGPYAIVNNSLSCNPPAFTPLLISKKNASCNGVCDGSISVLPNNLCLPASSYTYAWSNGSTQSSISNLCAGSYTLNMVSSANTFTSIVVQINQPALISTSLNSVSLNCLSDATVNINGGQGFPSPTLCSALNTLVTIGNGTISNGTTSYPSIYGNAYYSSKNQFLIRANELISQGFQAGKIKSISFNLISINGASVYNNFKIGMRHITDSVITSNGFYGGIQNVYGPQTISLTSVGWNNYLFNNNFNWDGVSNLIVETCFQNNSWTSNSPVLMHIVGFKSCLYKYADNNLVCGNSIPFIPDYKRPNMKLGFCQDTLIYLYQWSNGQTTYTANNLPAGLNWVKVTDANGCTNTTTFNTVMAINAGANATIAPGSTITIGGSPTASGNGPFTYSWNPPGNLNNSGIANPISSPTAVIIYTLTVTDINNCTATSTVEIALTLDIGLKNYKKLEASINVLPNPALSKVNVTSSSYIINSLSLYNNIGQPLLELENLNVMEKTLDIYHLPIGVYYIKIYTTEGSVTKKIIRE